MSRPLFLLFLLWGKSCLPCPQRQSVASTHFSRPINKVGDGFGIQVLITGLVLPSFLSFFSRFFVTFSTSSVIFLRAATAMILSGFACWTCFTWAVYTSESIEICSSLAWAGVSSWRALIINSSTSWPWKLCLTTMYCTCTAPSCLFQQISSSGPVLIRELPAFQHCQH